VSASVVTLVGGGPGDPELVTLAAEAALAAASCVVADEAVVALATALAPSAEVVAVVDGSVAVDTLLAARGRRAVVRLYRGDAWLHPGFTAERAALVAAGTTVEAVPGIAVEQAALAAAGVPAQVRQLAVTLTVGEAQDLPDPAPWRTVATATADLSRAAAVVAARADGGAGGPVHAAAALTVDGEALACGPIADLAAPGAPGVLVVGPVAGMDVRVARV
jgi:uroporphyrin-III C-methyltransferase / precorrin-2 dehydrogenase / sirohydrochlorin ferrochelatase